MKYIPILLIFVATSYGGDIDARFTCPGAGSFPNPEDCGSFYICATGSDPVLQDCPGDLLFDPNLKICNLADAVDCGATSDEPSTTSSTEPDSTTSPALTTTTEEPSISEEPSTSDEPLTTNSPGSGPDCPETGTWYLENPDDCTTFFVCIEGDYALVDCPVGYGFDEVTRDCKPSEEIGCEAPVTPPSNPVKCPPTGQTTLPNPDDCGSFFLCINGTSSLITCAIGSEFNKVSQKCEDPSTAGCSIPTEPTQSSSPTSTSSTAIPPGGVPDCSTRPNGDVFPNPKDCSTFFQCSNGLILTKNCPPGLEFNADLKVCDTPDHANCEEAYKYVI